MEQALPAIVYAATESPEITARRWRDATRVVLNIERNLILDAEFNATGDKVITALRNRTVAVWRTIDGTCLCTLVGHNGPVLTAQFNPQESMIVSASEDGTVKLWNASNGACMGTVAVAGVCSASFDNTGEALLIRARANAEIKSVPNLKTLLTIGETNEVQFCADNTIMACFRENNGLARIHTWNADYSPGPLYRCSKRMLRSITRIGGQFMGLDSMLLYKMDQTRAYALFIYPVEGQGIAIDAHKTEILEKKFNRRCNAVVSTSRDTTAKLWQINGQRLQTFTGHKGPVTGAAFSPDDSVLLTASQDGTLKLWDVANGKCMATLEEPDLQELGDLYQSRFLKFNAPGNAFLNFGKALTIWRKQEFGTK